MTKVLITGTCSFIGTNFKRYSQNNEITEISLFNKELIDIDFSKYDVILHLVAIVHQSINIPDIEYYKINHELCINVAKEAKKAGVKQFIFLSTVKVYGEYDENTGPWTESSSCNPTDGYGKSKYQAELDLRKLEDRNFTVSIIRTPLVYGVGVRANMHSIMSLIRRLPILPLNNINNKRCFTSAENLIAFIDRIIKIRASGVFIVKDQKSLSTTELIKLIAKGLNKKIILFKLPKFIVDLGLKYKPNTFDRLFGSFELDNIETLKKLEFEPPYSSHDCIIKMAKAFKKPNYSNNC